MGEGDGRPSLLEACGEGAKEFSAYEAVGEMLPVRSEATVGGVPAAVFGHLRRSVLLGNGAVGPVRMALSCLGAGHLAAGAPEDPEDADEVKKDCKHAYVGGGVDWEAGMFSGMGL